MLAEELAKDAAVREADTLLLTVPNMLGVDFNARLLETVVRHVAPAIGWVHPRPARDLTRGASGVVLPLRGPAAPRRTEIPRSGSITTGSTGLKAGSLADQFGDDDVLEPRGAVPVTLPPYNDSAPEWEAYPPGRRPWVAAEAPAEPPAGTRRSRRLAVAATVTGVLVLGGAGLAVAAYLDGSGPQPQDVLPADTLGFVSVDLDPSAGQKVALDVAAGEVPRPRHRGGRRPPGPAAGAAGRRERDRVGLRDRRPAVGGRPDGGRPRSRRGLGGGPRRRSWRWPSRTGGSWPTP